MSDASAPSHRLSLFARAVLFSVPVILAIAVAVGGWFVTRTLKSPPAPKVPIAHAGTDPDGGELFNFHCARCHGVNGDGNGPTPMFPKARHFGYERFKFTDTLTGVRKADGEPVPQGAAGTLGGIPTDDVLVALLKRGIDGSPMPSFDYLPDAELKAIVGYLRTRFLKPERLASARDDVAMRKEMAAAKDEGDDFDPKKDWPPKNPAKRKKWETDWQGWFTEALADTTSSKPCPVPTPFPEPKPGYEQRAALLFNKLGCLGCHGPDGHGTFDPNRKNDNGTLAFPRDLTAGVYKGGGESEHLYRRIYLGIPGTPMKAFGKEATPDEIVDLIYYVKNFSLNTPPTVPPPDQP